MRWHIVDELLKVFSFFWKFSCALFLSFVPPTFRRVPGGSRLFRERYKQNENEAPEIAPKGEEKGYTTVVPLGREKDSAFIHSQPVPQKSCRGEMHSTPGCGSGPGQQLITAVVVCSSGRRAIVSFSPFLYKDCWWLRKHAQKTCWTLLGHDFIEYIRAPYVTVRHSWISRAIPGTERRIRKNFFSFHFLLERQQHQGDSDRWELIIFTMYVTRREESARMR